MEVRLVLDGITHLPKKQPGGPSGQLMINHQVESLVRESLPTSTKALAVLSYAFVLMTQDNWCRICLPGSGKGRLQFGATSFVGTALVIIRLQSAGCIKSYMGVLLCIIGFELCVLRRKGRFRSASSRDGWGAFSVAILSM